MAGGANNEVSNSCRHRRHGYLSQPDVGSEGSRRRLGSARTLLGTTHSNSQTPTHSQIQIQKDIQIQMQMCNTINTHMINIQIMWFCSVTYCKKVSSCTLISVMWALISNVKRIDGSALQRKAFGSTSSSQKPIMPIMSDVYFYNSTYPPKPKRSFNNQWWWWKVLWIVLQTTPLNIVSTLAKKTCLASPHFLQHLFIFIPPPRWSPNSTYLHLDFYLLTYKEKRHSRVIC